MSDSVITFTLILSIIMFRLLKYIVLFLLGYKVLKVLFADNEHKQAIPKTPGKQNIDFNNDYQNSTTSKEPKFQSAEPIEYEDVK